jgi:polyisoprenoid-binding protein YceI
MRIVQKVTLSIGALCLCVGCGAAQAPEEVHIDFDPATTKVEFTLSDVLHTVHGAFRLKSGEMHFDPSTGAAGGSLVVDVASGDSGNKTRDRKMDKEILETEKYPEATFTPKQVVGHLSMGGSSQVQVQGTFRLHGADHEITLDVPAQVSGNQLQMQTTFQIPFVRWGMKDPSTFVLRVNKDVQMSISGTERISSGAQRISH